MITIKATAVRARFTELLEELNTGECDGIIISRYGRNIAMLLPVPPRQSADPVRPEKTGSSGEPQ